MKLSDLKPVEGARRNRKRVGRGVGSGLGKTAGRGSKGANARSGGGSPPGYEGGQMPMQRRLPKRGFTNLFKKVYAVVNVRDLGRFETGSTVDAVELVRFGLVKGRWDGIKLLGSGDVDRPLTVKLDHFSQAARAKIEAAGGTVEVVSS